MHFKKALHLNFERVQYINIKSLALEYFPSGMQRMYLLDWLSWSEAGSLFRDYSDLYHTGTYERLTNQSEKCLFNWQPLPVDVRCLRKQEWLMLTAFTGRRQVGGDVCDLVISVRAYVRTNNFSFGLSLSFWIISVTLFTWWSYLQTTHASCYRNYVMWHIQYNCE